MIISPELFLETNGRELLIFLDMLSPEDKLDLLQRLNRAVSNAKPGTFDDDVAKNERAKSKLDDLADDQIITIAGDTSPNDDEVILQAHEIYKFPFLFRAAMRIIDFRFNDSQLIEAIEHELRHYREIIKISTLRAAVGVRFAYDKEGGFLVFRPTAIHVGTCTKADLIRIKLIEGASEPDLVWKD